MTGLTYLMLFFLLMTLTVVIPRLLRYLFIPTVVSLLIIGIIIGPNGIDLVRRVNDLFGRGFPTERLYGIIEAIGLMGLVFLMALAGMEADLSLIKHEKKAVLFLSLFTFFIPATAGFFVYRFFDDKDIIGQLFYASLFASHSVGIVFPIIRELKVVKTRFGVGVLASTIITDIASLVLLAICVQLKRHQISSSQSFRSISIFDRLNPAVFGSFFIPLFLFAVMLFIILSLWLIPRLGRLLFSKTSPKDDTRLTLFLVTVLLVVFLGELIGVSVIVGAFIAGMALVRVEQVHDESRLLHKKLEGTGYGFFIPFLFLSIGMKTNLGILLSARQNLTIVGLTVAGLVGSKVFSGWLGMKLAGFSHIKSFCAGLMTVPQLSATLAAAAVGLELGIIGTNFFNAVVVLSIVTTIPIPILVKLIIVKGKIRFTSLEDKIKGLLPGETAQDEDYL